MKIDEMERLIARKVIDDALTGGCTISVDDGEDEVVTRSSDAELVFGAMFSTEEDTLHIAKDGKLLGSVRFIYGECGWDVIQDYSMSLSGLLCGVMKLSDELEEKARG